MNVYDEVNNLARAIRESKEYLEYKQIKSELSVDLQLKSQVDEFEKIRYEEQLLALQGEKQSEEKMKKLQELYEILVKNPQVKDYFDKEVRFNVMECDVEKAFVAHNVSSTRTVKVKIPEGCDMPLVFASNAGVTVEGGELTIPPMTSIVLAANK